MQFNSYKSSEATAYETPSSIEESGAYIVEIVNARDYKASMSNAVLVNFSFKDDKNRLGYASICVMKKDGTDNKMGVSQMVALFELTGVPQAQRHSIAGLDSNNNSVEFYPSLTKKRIGVILKVTPNPDGKYPTVSIDRWFDPATFQTATEKLENKPAQDVEKHLIRLLGDKGAQQFAELQAQYMSPVAKAKAKTTKPKAAAQATPAEEAHAFTDDTPGGVDALDDEDVPF